MNKLVDALEFYADPDNWTSTEKHMPSCMAFDKGMRAREVLSEHRAEPSADDVLIKNLVDCLRKLPSPYKARSSATRAYIRGVDDCIETINKIVAEAKQLGYGE